MYVDGKERLIFKKSYFFLFDKIYSNCVDYITEKFWECSQI